MFPRQRVVSLNAREISHFLQAPKIEYLLIERARGVSFEIDKRRVLVVPTGFIGVKPVDEMIVVHIPYFEKAPLISQQRLPHGAIPGNSTGFFAKDARVAGEPNILSYERRLYRHTLGVTFGTCRLKCV